MAEIKWIKLSANIFDNRKIRQIESMPEGDAIVVIWLKLLCLAGNINDGGLVYFTKEMPYTDEMLATQFDKPITIVRLAMNTFVSFGMIEIVDDILHISNWEKYQNAEGMEKIREQDRIRQARHREKLKLLAESRNVTVTLHNALDIDKNKIEEKEEIPPIIPQGEEEELPFSGELLSVFNDWLEYKKEKRQPYKPQGLKALITKTQNCASKYGDEAVIGVISDAMASNYQGILWKQLTSRKPQEQPRYDGKDFFDE